MGFKDQRLVAVHEVMGTVRDGRNTDNNRLSIRTVYSEIFCNFLRVLTRYFLGNPSDYSCSHRRDCGFASAVENEPSRNKVAGPILTEERIYDSLIRQPMEFAV
jgi:hypothetical protein